MARIPKSYLRDNAPDQMQIAAEKYEEKYGIRFSYLTYFAQELLNEYHTNKGNSDSSNTTVEIVSFSDKSILADIGKEYSLKKKLIEGGIEILSAKLDFKGVQTWKV